MDCDSLDFNGIDDKDQKPDDLEILILIKSSSHARVLQKSHRVRKTASVFCYGAVETAFLHHRHYDNKKPKYKLQTALVAPGSV